jgi:hypothetical protein
MNEMYALYINLVLGSEILDPVAAGFALCFGESINLTW